MSSSTWDERCVASGAASVRDGRSVHQLERTAEEKPYYGQTPSQIHRLRSEKASKQPDWRRSTAEERKPGADGPSRSK